MPWLENLQRPAYRRCISSVLTREEVSTVLGLMGGPTALLAPLLYGTGLPLPDSMRATADWVVPIFSAIWAWVKP